MPIQVLNFIDICSNAMLAVADNDHADIEKIPSGEYCIAMNNKFKSMIHFYTRSFCKNYRQFGTKTVVVNSCSPMSNWRQAERGNSIKASKYTLTDPECFVLEKRALENALENSWKKLKEELPEMVFIGFPDVDYYDVLLILKKFIKEGMVVHPFRFYFLKDINCEYMHIDPIPGSILNSIEIVLRANQLIL